MCDLAARFAGMSLTHGRTSGLVGPSLWSDPLSTAARTRHICSKDVAAITMAAIISSEDATRLF